MTPQLSTAQLSAKVLTHLTLVCQTGPEQKSGSEWNDFLVHAISGREQFSRLGKLTLVVSSANAPASEDADSASHPLLKQSVLLTWHSEDGEAVRTFAGLCTQVRQRSTHTDGRSSNSRATGDRAADNRTVYELVLRPQLVRLKWRSGSRCFRDKSAVEVAAALLTEHGVAHELKVEKEVQLRALTVQYRESDYALMKRLLAEEGLFFFVQHPPAGDISQPAKLIISDATWAYAPVPHLPPLELRAWTPRGGEDHLELFDVVSGGHQAAARLHKYDFRNPRRKQDAVADSPTQAMAERRETEGRGADASLHTTALRTTTLSHDHFEEQPHVDSDAAIARQQLQRNELIAIAATPSHRLMVGFQFTVPAAASSIKEWVVIELRHRAEVASGPPTTTETQQDNVRRPQVRLRCVPAATVYRPSRPNREAVTSAETAIVVGPKEARVHTDRHGRVKVRFHWDTTTSPEDSSCWVRVTQGWAGQGWGSQYIPRVGMEVAVGFIGGDPDRPLVTGCLYNGTHPPPFALPEGATRSGTRTRTVPNGAGHNEISFEDLEGSEEVLLRAQREFRHEVGEDAFADVGRHQQIAIGGNANTTIGEAFTMHVGGERRLSIDGNNVSRVQGASLLSATLLEEQVSGSTIRTCNDMSQHVAGNASLTIGGHYNLTIGAEEGGGVFDLAVHGPTTLLADDGLAIHSDKRVELVCGDSRLTLTPEGLFLNGGKVQVATEDSVLLSTADAELQLAPGRLEALATKVALDSQGASLLLDGNAHLDGTKVLLNCGGVVEGSELDGAEQDTKPIDVQLLDDRKQPYVDCRYDLVCTGRRYRGTTSGDGRVQHQVPKAAEQGTLTLWPEGVGKPRRTWQLQLTSIEPASTVKGAQARLQNLGYYQGSLDGQAGPHLKEAVARFQEDHGLPANGELDAPTIAAIEGAHS